MPRPVGDPGRRWQELLARPEDAVPLDEAAFLIAAHARPGLDVTAQLARLDELAGEVTDPTADAVSAVLFDRLGLTGNLDEYDDPANSFLDQVIDRRLGIPISLSVLLVEVGRRAGADLVGVGLPGHYVVRDRRSPAVLIDAFAGGRHLDAADCRQLMAAVGAPSASLRPADFPAAGHRTTLARMLNNLDGSFRRRQDSKGLTWVTRLRVAIPSQPVPLLVAAAGTLAELGRYDEAADILDGLARRDELPPDTAARVRAKAIAARSRLN
jgi:regulator of sirC expression with transglutaminase-like and TPR domain